MLLLLLLLAIAAVRSVFAQLNECSHSAAALRPFVVVIIQSVVIVSSGCWCSSILHDWFVARSCLRSMLVPRCSDKFVLA